MSKQRRKHVIIVQNEEAYKVSRRFAYWLGYKHQPRWRHSCPRRTMRTFTYAYFGPRIISDRIDLVVARMFYRASQSKSWRDKEWKVN